MTRRWGRSDEHPDFIEPIREMLLSFHIPFVIENVMGSPLRHPVMLCGSAFGLEVRRHRFFEMSDAPALYPVCQHTKKALAVFGHPGGSSKRAPEARFGSIQEWRDGMGIDWMDAKELAQSIPPAYTEWIGKRLLEQLNLKGGDALT
jgi:DNA (cytosine-5)-methyltransferase 1